MASEKLSNAIQLIKAGNRQAALPLLKEIIRTDPYDENAWLWLYACVEKVEEKKYCLQKALEINPNNQPARTQLEKLSKSAQPQVAAKKSDKRSNTRILVFGSATVFLVLLCLILPLLYLFQAGQLTSLAAAVPFLASATPQPTVTFTPTATADFTPSPLPTLTPTNTSRPSATLLPILSDLTELAPTPAAYTPGNPTATPYGRDIADPNFSKGIDAYNAKQYETAIKFMSAVIEANPNLAPPYRYRAIANSYLERCEQGMPDINKALEIDPNYASAWAGRGTLDLCLGDVPQAISDLHKALSLDGSLSVAHLNLGIAYYRLEKYAKSLNEYDMAVTIDPSRIKGWTGKSQASARLALYQECIENANKALDLDAKEWIAYPNRAECELALKKFEEALKDYEFYAQNNPNDRLGSYNIGVAHSRYGDFYYDAGNYKQAIAEYKLAVSLVQGDAHSYCQLAYSYFELKEYKDSLDAARASIIINPACGGKKILVIMARSSYALKDYVQAHEYIDQAIQISQSAIDLYYRGIINQAEGNKTEAIKDLKSFLSQVDAGDEVDDAKARLAQLEP